MLVNATEMLIKARDGHYGVPQFNINNLEWTKAVLTACEEMKSPVILGVSEGAGKYMTGFKTVAAMVSSMVETMGITVPVALHLDHGTYEGCKACVEAGFSSIMFDGSHYSIEENVEKTKELVALAHSKGLSIEAEVGSIGGVEDGVVGAGEIADPAECAKITDLGIDFLAPAELDYLKTIVFILVIAALVQLVEMFLKKTIPSLYRALGVYLPLITTNCAVLGVALINVQKDYTILQGTIYGLATAIGFTIAMVLMAGLREKMEYNDIPESFKGMPIVLLTAMLMSMAFMGFSGMI